MPPADESGNEVMWIEFNLVGDGAERVKLANIETPTGPYQAANRKYVDDAIQALINSLT